MLQNVSESKAESYKTTHNFFVLEEGRSNSLLQTYKLVVLRAVVRKYRLEVCKMKKSNIPKLCQNISLGKLFLEK